MDTDKPTHPTEGGSYVREPGGALRLVEQTKPAPAPIAAEPPRKPAPLKKEGK
jgi:hypothetical protein